MRRGVAFAAVALAASWQAGVARAQSGHGTGLTGESPPHDDRLGPPTPPPLPEQPPPPPGPIAPLPPTKVEVVAPANDDGRHLQITFTRAEQADAAHVVTVIFRRKHGTPNPPPAYPVIASATAAGLRFSPEFLAGGDPSTDAAAKLETGATVGPWKVASVLEAGEQELKDEVAPGVTEEYVVAELRRDDEGRTLAFSPGVAIGPRVPEAALFHTKRWGYLLIVVLIASLVGVYIRIAKARPKDIFIRRMPGVDALEDAVGRSTEMGRPVLYVTGLEEIQDIMTIASLLILGHVAELTANYDTELKVANYYPLTMVVAEEIVRQGYANAGRIDAHRPENVLFITAEQFAFAAGVNGIILRDRPATNIYFGKFFGESLLLAETGFLTGAIQIAGTAELPQLPFFIAACDYTLIGEELYATSAYLSREPTLLANLKAGDAFKLIAIGFIILGVVSATAIDVFGFHDGLGLHDLGHKVFP